MDNKKTVQQKVQQNATPMGLYSPTKPQNSPKSTPQRAIQQGLIIPWSQVRILVGAPDFQRFTKSAENQFSKTVQQKWGRRAH